MFTKSTAKLPIYTQLGLFLFAFLHVPVVDSGHICTAVKGHCTALHTDMLIANLCYFNCCLLAGGVRTV